jgi:tight adherence protein C
VNQTQLLVVAALALFAGSTLLLSHVRWFRRRPLADRLAPYVPGGMTVRSTSILVSAETFGQVIGPLARAVGERVARAVGVTEPLAVRLERIGSRLDVTGFRVRQLGWAAVGLMTGTVLAVAAQLSGPAALLLIMTGPLIGFLVVEQRLAMESQAWQRRVFLELPVVAEQLGMLLSAGYSLGAGLGRLATRGKGACGPDLRRVVGRIRQGLSETEALREWAAVADVDALHRLVGVLALNRQSGDLGRLIGEEARAIRCDVHRDLIETIERRSQQVWIPVTVAALVPGAIFLAVPFIDALSLFANS